jgi:hypothetical protein
MRYMRYMCYMRYTNRRRLAELEVSGPEDKGGNLLRKVSKYPPIGNEPYPRRLAP